MEVTWNTVDLEKAFHTTTFLLLDVLNDTLEYGLVVHACFFRESCTFVAIKLSIGQTDLNQIIHDID